MVLRRLKQAEPVDAASLGIFRIAFGVLVLIAALRFFSHGWIRKDYIEAHHFFAYWGLSWLRPLPGIGMYVVYAVLALAAVLVAIGLAYRVASIVLFATFTFAHLSDKANYLNHYYLVSLLALLVCVLPLDRCLSLRVRLRPDEARGSIPAWCLWLLRFQVGVVYLFGAVAKMGSDWLLRAEPLRIWLAGDRELPLLGHLVRHGWFPYAMSWGGMLFDLCIVPLLLWRRTRTPAYLLVLVFHLMTAALFQIGMFPWIMIASATLFFDPTWPRRLLRGPVASGVADAPLGGVGRALIAVYACLQLALPLRHFLYPGNTLWTEEGFRFAWRVMLIEKSGELELTVVDAAGRRTIARPRDYLSPLQVRMASTQPDMILQLAHLVADDYAQRGRGPVQVFADAQVSWNGRRRAPMIDPTVDLARERDGLAPKRWILPAPTSAPEF